MDFKMKLQKLRKSRGLTQEEFSEIMNVSRQAVSKWESGQSLPEIDKLIEISDYFGVTIDYLIRDEAEIPNQKCVETKQYEVKNDTNESRPNSLLFDSKEKQTIIRILAAGCMSICFFALATADQCPSFYQTIIRIIECLTGISISILTLVKMKRFNNSVRS